MDVAIITPDTASVAAMPRAEGSPTERLLVAHSAEGRAASMAAEVAADTPAVVVTAGNC
jgi:hypothetical protein